MSKLNKKLLLGYIIWVIIQFVLLAVSGHFSSWDSSFFWPWGKYTHIYDLQSYDWFEFFVYCAIPPIIYGIYKLVKSIKNDN